MTEKPKSELEQMADAAKDVGIAIHMHSEFVQHMGKLCTAMKEQCLGSVVDEMGLISQIHEHHWTPEIYEKVREYYAEEGENTELLITSMEMAREYIDTLRNGYLQLFATMTDPTVAIQQILLELLSAAAPEEAAQAQQEENGNE